MKYFIVLYLYYLQLGRRRAILSFDEKEFMNAAKVVCLMFSPDRSFSLGECYREIRFWWRPRRDGPALRGRQILINAVVVLGVSGSGLINAVVMFGVSGLVNAVVKLRVSGLRRLWSNTGSRFVRVLLVMLTGNSAWKFVVTLWTSITVCWSRSITSATQQQQQLE